MHVAETISERSTCLRRVVGAIIVKNDRIISSGYVGAPKKEPNCTDIGACLREELKVPSGMFYEICRSVHAEENAIINAASSGADIHSGILYLFSKARGKEHYPKEQKPTALYLPCYRCKKTIINSGLEQIIVLANNQVKELSLDDLRTLLRKDEEKMKENFLKHYKDKVELAGFNVPIKVWKT